jgi:hypothetical protein
MDSFVRLYALYKSITRWRIVVHVYGHAGFPWKPIMWIGKLLFVLFAGLQFFFNPPMLYFALMLLSACIWAWSFGRSRRSAFAEQYRLYPERIRYFAYDYQYIRYLQFRDKLQDSFSGSIADALSFLNKQIETDSRTAISAHPVMSFLVASALAILGGAAGQWPAKYIIAILFLLIACLYFLYMVLGVLHTRQSDLKEFKRFLLWAEDEQLET